MQKTFFIFVAVQSTLQLKATVTIIVLGLTIKINISYIIVLGLTIKIYILKLPSNKD